VSPIPFIIVAITVVAIPTIWDVLRGNRQSSAPNKKLRESVPELQERIRELSEQLKKNELRIMDLMSKGKKVVAERDRLEAELNRKTAAQGDDKFIAAKRAFAKLYHPNNAGLQGIEKTIRSEVFKEFWEVLETIDKT
jgi:hypothetical protein